MASQPFDWAGYLRLANELASRNDEACLRSSLSRAYYYVYHLALIRARRNGFQARPGESTHVQLWRLYNGSPEPACLNLGQMALRLKEKRERADYDSVLVQREMENWRSPLASISPLSVPNDRGQQDARANWGRTATRDSMHGSSQRETRGAVNWLRKE
jgi:hypothetical protein